MQIFCLPVLELLQRERNLKKKKVVKKRNTFIWAWRRPFPGILNIFVKKERKKEWYFETENLLYHKIKIVLLWHCQNATRWLHFGIFSSGFVIQNIQLEAGRMCRISSFCQTVLLACVSILLHLSHSQVSDSKTTLAKAGLSVASSTFKTSS